MTKLSTAIFADIQNLYYTTREAYSANFDYNRFWADVSAQHNIVSAHAYAIDRGDEKQRQFQNILRAIGFDVKLKPFIQRSDGSSKGDWDVGITIDVIHAAQEVEHIILMSGDGDFTILVETLKERYNLPVTVYAVPQLTATSLMRSASTFVAIEESLLLNYQSSFNR